MASQLAERQTSASLPKGRGKGPGGQPQGLLPPPGRCPVPGCGDPVDATRAYVPPRLEPAAQEAAGPGVGDLALRARVCQPRAPAGSA